MHLSIFSDVITGASPEEVARKTREYGLRSVQFIPEQVQIGFGFDQERTLASYERWANAYQREGIEICGMGGYINLLHHDSVRRQHNIELFKSFLRGMKTLGCRYISTETGSYSPTGDWNFDPKNRTPAALEDLRRVTNELLEVAVHEDVVILYEPYIVNVCSTPEIGAQFVREVDSPHLGLLMDPTNWFEIPMAQSSQVRAVMERGFAAEQGLFRLAHAKDVTPAPAHADRPGLPGPGQGILDYERYVQLLKAHDYDGPLVIEHLVEEEVPVAMAYVQRFIDA